MDKDLYDESSEILNDIDITIKAQILILRRNNPTQTYEYLKYITRLGQEFKLLYDSSDDSSNRKIYENIYKIMDEFIKFLEQILFINDNSDELKRVTYEKLNDFYINIKDKIFRSIYNKDKYRYIHIMFRYLNYDPDSDPDHYTDDFEDEDSDVEDSDKKSGGKSQKLKKTNNKIKVLYKKKEYTRVIYVNKNNKKFVKINKQILELSKLKKIK